MPNPERPRSRRHATAETPLQIGWLRMFALQFKFFLLAPLAGFAAGLAWFLVLTVVMPGVAGSLSDLFSASWDG